MKAALNSLTSRVSRLVERWKVVDGWWKSTHVGKTIKLYGERGGNVLAAGIAYFSLTSIAAALLLGVTIGALLLGSYPGIKEAFINYLHDALPGVIAEPGEPGLVNPDNISVTPVTGVLGLVALILLLNRCARYAGGMRSGLTIMIGTRSKNTLLGKAHEYAAVVLILVITLVGTVLQIGASRIGRSVASSIGEAGVSEWAIRLPAMGAGLITDALFVYVALVVLGHAKYPWKRMLVLLGVSAFAIGVLRLLSSELVGRISDNVILAPFLGIFILLVFVDMVNRIVLHGGAWIGVHRKEQRERQAQARSVRDAARSAARTRLRVQRRHAQTHTQTRTRHHRVAGQNRRATP